MQRKKKTLGDDALQTQLSVKDGRRKVSFSIGCFGSAHLFGSAWHEIKKAA